MFNSGVEIEEILKEFCKLSDKYKYINYRYFLNTDAIILFKFQEWVELFIKFNYVLGRIDKKDITQNLMKKYHNLETKFTILLINGEKMIKSGKFHIHTLASDGQLEEEDILREVNGQRNYIVITDHDILDRWSYGGFRWKRIRE